MYETTTMAALRTPSLKRNVPMSAFRASVANDQGKDSPGSTGQEPWFRFVAMSLMAPWRAKPYLPTLDLRRVSQACFGRVSLARPLS